MANTKQITCIISGKQTVYSGPFLEKTIAEYGSEEALDRLYVSREAKSLLKKGYRVIDIRKILNVDDTLTLPPEDVVKIVEDKFIKNNKLKERPSFNESITSFTYNKSDPDVEQFINDYIINV
tara:strand:- start:539 stop:907 length:369 start_codon:yes stop_codon:yes gene_type:complete